MAKPRRPGAGKQLAASPTAAVHARVKTWTPALKSGLEVRDNFTAGKAKVSAVVTPDVPGDVDRGIAALDRKLVAAVIAVQGSAAKVTVTVPPEAKLGLRAAAEVKGVRPRS